MEFRRVFEGASSCVAIVVVVFHLFLIFHYLSFPSPRTRRRTRTPRSLSLRTDENDVHGDLNNTHTRRRRRTEAAQDQEALPGGHDRAGAARDARALDVGVAEREGPDGGHAVPVRRSHAALVAEEGQGECGGNLGLKGTGQTTTSIMFLLKHFSRLGSHHVALWFIIWTMIIQYIYSLMFHRTQLSHGSGASSRW